MTSRRFLGVLVAVGGLISPARAEVMHYGDPNLLGMGVYSSDPTAGASLQGLAPNVVTVASNRFSHGYPFVPATDAYPGTDRIYSSGGPPTGLVDGYSLVPNRVDGPDVINMDYGSLVGPGQRVETLTLGIAPSDIQHPMLGQPYEVKVNGVVNEALTHQFNVMDLGGPSVQFFTAGIDPSLLLPSHVLNLSIARAGTAADGWAVDFTTIGVTAVPVPEPTSIAILGLGIASWAIRRSRTPCRGTPTA